MATLGLIWYGGWRVLTGQTSIGTVIAFIMLLKEMYLPINRISELNTILHNSLAAIDRVFEVFDIEPDVQESARARELPRIEGRIRFDHVTFAYNDPTRPQIRDVDLEIAPGEVVALVGPSGAGKSTLIQLIPRFYDPQQGCVRVDGWDVREVKLRSLRSQIGMVAQDTLLFSGSVRDNLLYGRPDATPGQMVEAARAAHAHDFLNALPDGYDTLLGERGAKLSGGQKQRLALARAFLCDPRILILDEATSALDSESEMLIQEALGRLMKGRTSLIIAHRLSTILNSDRIVVMDAGQVVEVGTHRQLLENHGLYARLYETQFRSAYAEESARFS
jgi:subfamily B ATP-binding cassette protein MsbA